MAVDCVALISASLASSLITRRNSPGYSHPLSFSLLPRSIFSYRVQDIQQLIYSGRYCGFCRNAMLSITFLKALLIVISITQVRNDLFGIMSNACTRRDQLTSVKEDVDQNEMKQKSKGRWVGKNIMCWTKRRAQNWCLYFNRKMSAVCRFEHLSTEVKIIYYGLKWLLLKTWIKHVNIDLIICLLLFARWWCRESFQPTWRSMECSWRCNVERWIGHCWSLSC